jgi:hypothetical protein
VNVRFYFPANNPPTTFHPQSTALCYQVFYTQDCFQQPSVPLTNEKYYVQFVADFFTRLICGNEIFSGTLVLGINKICNSFLKQMFYSFILVGYCSCIAKADGLTRFVWHTLQRKILPDKLGMPIQVRLRS